MHVEHAAAAAQPGGGTPHRSRAWGQTLPLVALGVAAVALRLAAAQGDLVFDEIWSLRIAELSDSAGQIFFMPVDNNHILNTLVLYALGPRAPFWAYRVPAVVAGSLAVWFAFRLARRQGTWAAFSAVVLLGFSHPLILFGSEARGYGYLACFTLAAWWSLEKYLERLRLRYVIKFGIASSLGFLSHLTFMFGYLAVGVYSVMKLRSRRDCWRRLVVLHRIPALTCFFLYLAYIRGMAIGGGTVVPLFDTLLATLSLMAGGPERGEAAYVAAFTMAALLAVSLATEFQRDRARGVLFLTAIVLAPGIVLTATGHVFIYPRYFLVSMIFGYVAIGSLFGRWLQTGGLGRTTASLLLAAYVACNLAPVARLIGQGRARYTPAVRWMAEQTAGPNVTIASDHDIRNGWLVEFYAKRESQSLSRSAKQFVYVTSTEYGQQGTEWFLRHTFSGDPELPNSLTDPFGNKYELLQVFPADSISGWTWWVYRRVTH